MNDIEELRRQLIDYYGTQAQIFPAAYMKVEEVKRMTDEEILAEAAKVLKNQTFKRR